MDSGKIGTVRKKPIEWLLRIGVFGIFLGHGMYAWQAQESWVPFLTFWGFSAETAKDLMPIIGVIDILVAIITLIKPNRYILMYAVFWAFATALMRPLTGSLIWAFVERAGNWIVPLCLLLMLRNASGVSHNPDPI
ncbi:MAG: hypothetical protein KTR24_03420 [Saprospiraceae bacterium]|nr:hypothetical protein [Saprospiraceae bacterium]